MGCRVFREGAKVMGYPGQVFRIFLSPKNSLSPSLQTYLKSPFPLFKDQKKAPMSSGHKGCIFVQLDLLVLGNANTIQKKEAHFSP